MAITVSQLCWFWGFYLTIGAYGLQINVTTDGQYNISHDDNSVWLRSAPPFFVINNVTYSAADNTLTFLGFNKTELPGNKEYFLSYKANETVIVASIHLTSLPEVVRFSVTFPQGASGTKAKSPDDVICGFPGFRIDEPPARFAYLSYGLSTFEAAAGRWQNDSVLLYGGRLGSGPMALFDNNSLAIVMGPSSAYTVTSLWHDFSGGNIYWGIMGGVTHLPAGFQYDITLTGNNNGIRSGIGIWAMVVRSKLVGAAKDKTMVRNQAIPVPGNLLGTLGYWTSPGSAYYTSPAPGMTYESTLINVRHYSFDNDTERTPRVDYVHVEVDDWWYVKGQNGGVKSWTAETSIFPDGVPGLANKTQWSVAVACGVWAPDNVYSKQNGGQYDFLHGDQCALPQDQKFWDFLFANTVHDKLRVFVQKNMETQYMCMTSGDSDVTTIATWLSQLNVSATENNMEVMFSGALPRLVLEVAFNLNMDIVVQVGASNATKDANHWKVGVANVLLDALNLRPFFGVFKSENNESEILPATQLSPELYNILATLTGGPVAVGDAIEKSNKMLIDRCCSADGRVLAPLRLLGAIDAQFQQMAWGGNAGVKGEVYTSFTGNRLNSPTSSNFFMGIILAVGVTGPFAITPKSAGLTFVAEDKNVPLYTPTKIFSWHNPYLLYDFTETQPFTLSNCTVQDYCLYYAAPIINFKGKEVVIMGDFFKWVPLSSYRIDHITVTDKYIDVYVRGVPDEKVYIYLNVGGHMQSLEEHVGPFGDALIRYEEGGVLPGSAGIARSSWGGLVVAWMVCCAARVSLVLTV